MFDSSLSRPLITPETKLAFILKFFKLDSGKGAVKNFENFQQELGEVAFAAPAPNGLFLQKACALHAVMNPDGSLPATPDLTDPLDTKFVRVEELLRRYGVTRRPDYQEILLEVILLVILYDRVENTSWALENLTFRDTVSKPPPALRSDRKLNMRLLLGDFNFKNRRQTDGLRHRRTGGRKRTQSLPDITAPSEQEGNTAVGPDMMASSEFLDGSSGDEADGDDGSRHGATSSQPRRSRTQADGDLPVSHSDVSLSEGQYGELRTSMGFDSTRILSRNLVRLVKRRFSDSDAKPEQGTSNDSAV